MKRHVILMPSILTFAILGLSPPATAQVPNFTITVPVELNDIHPDVQTVTVQCQLVAGGQPAGILGPATITLDGTRSFSGPVRIEGNSGATTEAGLLAINSYRCYLTFFAAQGRSQPSTNHVWLALRPKEGTEFVAMVTGTIEPGG